MIEKLLEMFFRRKLLVLMPPLVITLIVSPIAVLTIPSYYESVAGVWVDRPTYFSVPIDESTRYLSPNAAQAVQLSELLRTRSFLVDVANRTSLTPLTASTAGQERVGQLIQNSVGISSPGNHLLVLNARSYSPDLAYQLVNAVFDSFHDKAESDRLGQAEVAISFYEGRVKEAQTSLSKSNDALRRYVAANPRLSGVTVSDPLAGNASLNAARAALPAAATDPQLSELMRQSDTDQREVERVSGLLEQARLQISASIEGQELGFQMVDPPQVAVSPTRERRKALFYPIAGLLVGLILSATILVLLVALDGAAWSEADLIARGRVLGVVPILKLDSALKRKSPGGARRAIGFVAGMALPAPRGGNA
jgi:uncharacterized protein involved in exopolysaccharide biosynthesis